MLNTAGVPRTANMTIGRYERGGRCSPALQKVPKCPPRVNAASRPLWAARVSGLQLYPHPNPNPQHRQITHTHNVEPQMAEAKGCTLGLCFHNGQHRAMNERSIKDTPGASSFVWSHGFGLREKCICAMLWGCMHFISRKRVN